MNIPQQWTYKPTDEAKVEKLYKSLKINKTLCKLLVQRGIETFDEAKTYFRPSLEQLHAPFLMKDMDKAVNRIITAIKNKQKILFYGDYDVDGTTSVALCMLFFKQFYENIDFYVPDRNKEGYGISIKGIDFATKNNFSLMVALDCGIKAIEKVNYANEKGLNIIICDHHTPADELPKACAILNPKQKECIYPYKELSGCGIGFKLCQAYAQKHFIKDELLYQFLDLVCISIASDIVPITDENRILAHFGLKQLNTKPSVGLKNMVELLDLKKDFTINDVVFKIGPRINAAGRMAHAKMAVDVLMGKEIVKELQDNNQKRQALDRDITEEAIALLANENENRVSNVVYQESWHKGVIGIVASRITETYYKPTVVLCHSNGRLTGSVRSVEGFNVYEPLEACSHLFTNFGGHAFAAGVTLEIENFETFKQQFDDEVRQRILPEQLIPKMEIDSTITLYEINKSFYNILKQFAPFGPYNMRPVFVAKNLTDTGQSKIVGENHLKTLLADKEGNTLNGIAFNMADKLPLLKEKVDVCFALEENEWNGTTTLQMHIKDIRESE